MTQTAKNYAQALFELHVDAESVKTTEEILKTVPEVGRSLTNPTIPFRVKEQIIGRIFPDGTRKFYQGCVQESESGYAGRDLSGIPGNREKAEQDTGSYFALCDGSDEGAAGKDQTVPVSEVSCKGSSAFLNKRRKPDRRIYSPGGRSGV